MKKHEIKKQNEKERAIKTDRLWPKQHIRKYLTDNIKPDWNFLINGATNRKSVLFQRILQLYQASEILQRPIVIISSNNELLNRIEDVIYNREVQRIRPFVKIDMENPCYKPFAGMDAYEIENALAVLIASDNTINFEQWNKKVFHAVCKVLEKYQYVLSIENLKKIFKSKEEDIVQMLRTEGFQSETEQTNGNITMAIKNRSFYHVKCLYSQAFL